MSIHSGFVQLLWSISGLLKLSVLSILICPLDGNQFFLLFSFQPSFHNVFVFSNSIGPLTESLRLVSWSVLAPRSPQLNHSSSTLTFAFIVKTSHKFAILNANYMELASIYCADSAMRSIKFHWHLSSLVIQKLSSLLFQMNHNALTRWVTTPTTCKQ